MPFHLISRPVSNPLVTWRDLKKPSLQVRALSYRPPSSPLPHSPFRRDTPAPMNAALIVRDRSRPIFHPYSLGLSHCVALLLSLSKPSFTFALSTEFNDNAITSRTSHHFTMTSPS
ncbi:hypothetical protein K438DRAFT_1884572 [Mycena galopus ATCC 62051]|nr:hypothetical protein K438DRAFT_1884572 [Mycena galopus ATCC 62051]